MARRGPHAEIAERQIRRHYGRFLSVRQEFDALRQADQTFEPVRPVLGAFLRQPFDIATPRSVITHPQPAGSPSWLGWPMS
jgi:hypothetical protein